MLISEKCILISKLVFHYYMLITIRLTGGDQQRPNCKLRSRGRSGVVELCVKRSCTPLIQKDKLGGEPKLKEGYPRIFGSTNNCLLNIIWANYFGVHGFSSLSQPNRRLISDKPLTYKTSLLMNLVDGNIIACSIDKVFTCFQLLPSNFFNDAFSLLCALTTKGQSTQAVRKQLKELIYQEYVACSNFTNAKILNFIDIGDLLGH